MTVQPKSKIVSVIMCLAVVVLAAQAYGQAAPDVLRATSPEPTLVVKLAGGVGEPKVINAVNGEQILTAESDIALGDVITTSNLAKVAISIHWVTGDNPEDGLSIASRSGDVLVIGPSTKIELVARAADAPKTDPPVVVVVHNGVFRAVHRIAGSPPTFLVKTGDRIARLKGADFIGVYDPAKDDGTYLLRSGDLKIEMGRRKIRLTPGLGRQVQGGRMRAARRIHDQIWSKAVEVTNVRGVSLAQPGSPSGLPPRNDPPAESPFKTNTPPAAKDPGGATPSHAKPSTRQNADAQGEDAPPKTDPKSEAGSAKWEPVPTEYHETTGPPKMTIRPPTEELIYMQIITSKGAFALELNNKLAPISTKNFIEYAKAEYYGQTVFHRVISGRMSIIQGGGFLTGMEKRPTAPAIKNEWENGLKNTRGTIAMARLGGQPNSATNQFYINVTDNTMLDRPQPDGAGYAVFGRVVQGMAVVDAICKVETGVRGGMRDVPVKDVEIYSVIRITAEQAGMAKKSAEKPVTKPGPATRATEAGN